jgi:hypothetical protein
VSTVAVGYVARPQLAHALLPADLPPIMTPKRQSSRLANRAHLSESTNELGWLASQLDHSPPEVCRPSFPLPLRADTTQRSAGQALLSEPQVARSRAP